MVANLIMEATEQEVETFFTAIQENKEDVVRTMMSRNPSIKDSIFNELTPLMYAVQNHHIIIIQHLIADGADKYFRNTDGQTVFSIAKDEVESATTELARQRARVILEELYLPNIGSNASLQVGLFTNILRGDMIRVKYVIDTYPTVVNRRFGENTPILIAVHTQSIPIVSFLLSKNADPSIQTPNGVDAIVLAKKRLNGADTPAKKEVATKILEMLLAVNPEELIQLFDEIIKGSTEKAIAILEAHPDFINRKQRGETPLTAAVNEQNLPLVEWLVEHGADKTIKNDIRGMTAFQLAYEYRAAGTGGDTAKAIMKEVREPPAPEPELTPEQLEKQRALIEAIRGNQVGKVSKLATEDIINRSYQGKTPLLLARHVNVVRALVWNGADKRIESGDDNILPIELARQNNERSLIWVLENEDVPTSKEREDHTMLFDEIKRQTIQRINTLIRIYPRIINILLNDETPLIAAVKGGSLTVVQFLELLGADKNIADSNGRLPVDWAKELGKMDIFYTLGGVDVDVIAAEGQLLETVEIQYTTLPEVTDTMEGIDRPLGRVALAGTNIIFKFKEKYTSTSVDYLKGLVTAQTHRVFEVGQRIPYFNLNLEVSFTVPEPQIDIALKSKFCVFELVPSAKELPFIEKAIEPGVQYPGPGVTYELKMVKMISERLSGGRRKTYRNKKRTNRKTYRAHR